MADALASSFYEAYRAAATQISSSTLIGNSVKPQYAQKFDHSKTFTDIFDAVKAGALDEFIRLSRQHNCFTTDDSGHTLAHWAALGGHRDIICYLIDNKITTNEPSQHEMGQYPIHWACINGHVNIVDILLQHGAYIDQLDARGASPLLVAAQYGRLMVCGFLMARGANICLTDKEGDTALHWAAFKGNADLCRLLVYSGISPLQPDYFGQTTLHMACIAGNLRVVKDFCRIDHVDVEAKDSNGNTALRLAQGRKYEDIVSFLEKEMAKKKRNLPEINFQSVIYGPTGSRVPIMFFVFLLVFWAYPMYVIKGIPLSFDHFPWLHYLFMASNFVMWTSLYHANSVDPGYLPRNTRDYDDTLRQVSYYGRYSKSPGGGDNPLNYLCHTCRTVRPIRASHCRYCNRCVRGFDHHCPYIDNCVGENNRHSFVILMSSLFSTGFLGVYISLHVWGLEQWVTRYDYYLGFIIMFLFGLLILYVSAGAWYNVYYNLTSNEKIRWTRYRYLQDEYGRFRNPFDNGVLRNVLYFFHIIKSTGEEKYIQSILEC